MRISKQDINNLRKQVDEAKRKLMLVDACLIANRVTFAFRSYELGGSVSYFGENIKAARKAFDLNKVELDTDTYKTVDEVLDCFESIVVMNELTEVRW